jgi:hypothetical protein
MSAFGDQLTVGFDLRGDGGSRALCGGEIDELLNGSLGTMTRGVDFGGRPG